MQQFRLINIALILAILLSLDLEAQLSAEIYTEYSVSDTVDFGFVLYQKSKGVAFTIKNTGTKPIKIQDLKPSYSIETTGLPGHTNDHEEFRSNFLGIKILEPNESFNITVTYYAEKDTSNYKFGFKIAKLILGVFDASLPDSIPPQDENKYIALRTFYLKAYKVKNPLSFADNSLDLPPVYLNPPSPFLQIFKFQNMSDDTIKILKQFQTYKTPFIKDELTISNKTNLILPPNTPPQNINIFYSPVDTLKDTSILGMIYQYNNTIDTIFTEIRAYPAFQRMSVFGSDLADAIIQDNNTYIDTVNIGKIRVGGTKKAKLYLINNGNISFKATDQQILEGYSNENPSENFYLSSKFPENVDIQPSQIDSTLEITFTPNTIGKFVARYKLKSDILQRNIANVPKYKEYETIILKGEGLSSLLTPSSDTLNFGIISSTPNCNSSRTITLKLKNTGNENLIINKINITPPFEIYENPSLTKEILPSQVDSIRIIFSDTTVGKYSGDLIFVTNSVSRYNTIKVHLLAERVPLSNIKISIPKNIRIKPGNKVSIPILVDREQIIKAKSFNCEITFERTLLKYYNFDKINTASQNTYNNDIKILESQEGGLLNLSIHTPNMSEYFLQSDTLINLIFDSYIGNTISTPLSIINPVFGDGICDGILITEIESGLFTIDSVCSLSEKLINSSAIPFFISEFQPNPSLESSSLIYQIKSEISLKITLFNQLGNIIKILHSGQIKPGIYEIQLNTSELSTGIYYVQFQTGFLTIGRKLIVSK